MFIGGEIVGNMLPTSYRIVDVSSVGAVANMLTTYVGNMLYNNVRVVEFGT